MSTTQARPSGNGSSGAQDSHKPEIAETLSPRTRLIATIGAALALALASIDISIVSTALPRIAEDLDGLNLYSWVGVGYAVSTAALVPVAGKLGDMFGRKPFLLIGLTGLLVLSLLCGLSQNMTQLVAFRTIQGVFAGFLMANIFTLAADVYTAEKRTKIQGVFFSVSGLSMVIGPPVGGFITDSWSWRWVFYIAVPIGLVALLALIVAVPRVESSARWRDIDFAGMITLLCGLVPALIALSLAGADHSWGSATVLVPLIIGVLMLGVFYVVETRYAQSPIVPFALFRSNQFSVMVGVAFFSAFAMMGTLFYVPLLYQGVLGVSASYSGSLVIPMTLALMIVPPFASKALLVIPKYRVLAVAAFACMAVGFFMLTQIDPGSSHALPLVPMVLVGIGIGISFPMATAVTQSSVSMDQIVDATSQIQFWRMIAGPVCLALLGSILTANVGSAVAGASSGDVSGGGLGSVDPAELAHALHIAFFVCLIVAVAGMLVSLVLREVPVIDMKQMMKQAATGGGKSDEAAGAAKAADGAAGETGADGLTADGDTTADRTTTSNGASTSNGKATTPSQDRARARARS